MFNHQAKYRVVIDMNILISAILFPNSMLAKAVDKAFKYYDIYASNATVNEFLEVIQRPKFDKYFVAYPNKKEIFINNFINIVNIIDPTEHITDCQDPKDNKFL